MDVPKADYTEIRRSLPDRHSAAHATLLDPRLRRLIDPNDELLPSASSTAPSINQIFSISSPPQHDPTETTDAFVVSTQKATLVDTSSRPSRPSAPRSDPRRKQQQDTKPAAQPQPTIQHIPSTQSTTNLASSSAHQLDTQAIHSSDWYKDLSSKHKIMVNQQMAIVAAELRKFHNDTAPNKIFDLTFVRQNQLLQQVLTQLGTYIDENGHFVKLDEPVAMNDHANHQHRGRMVDDFATPPPHPQHPMDFVRPPPQQHQQQQHGGNFHLDGSGGGPSFGVRPGLLGAAPPPVRCSAGGNGNEFNGHYENGNGGGGFDGNNGGYQNPFNPAMYGGRAPAPQQIHQQQSGAPGQYARGGGNHNRWGGNNQQGGRNNRRGFENTNQHTRD